LAADTKLINPSTGEVVKGIFTLFTTEAFTDDSIDLITIAPYAETTVVFPT